MIMFEYKKDLLEGESMQKLTLILMMISIMFMLSNCCGSIGETLTREDANDLIAEGEVNSRLCDGRTALMWAAYNGYTDIMEQLLAKGADPDIQSDFLYTALMYACQGGQTEAARMLIENGANMNLQQHDGWTALMLAAEHENQPVLELVVERGADLDIQAHEGWTVLMIAAQNGLLQSVQHLVENGANMDMQHNQGWTTLMFALDRGHLEIAKYLILKCADINIQNRYGSTAFDVNYPMMETILNNYELRDAAYVYCKSDNIDSRYILSNRFANEDPQMVQTAFDELINCDCAQYIIDCAIEVKNNNYNFAIEDSAQPTTFQQPDTQPVQRGGQIDNR